MTTAPGPTAWMIGKIRITRVMELDRMTIPPFGMLQATPEDIQRHPWLMPHYATPEGNLNVHIQAFIIDNGTHHILVDPCCGNDKDRPNFPPGHQLQTGFLDHLAQAGYPAESIDMVVCTHLHMDHVGWNTRLIDGQWVPSFPNARYLFGRVEHDHTLAHPEEEGAIYADSIGPVMASGQADLVEFGHHVSDGVRLVPTPGHTPGHNAIEIHSEGETALITGDLIHHPAQAASLTINSNFCFDHDAARETRKSVLADAAERGITMIGSHFADPTAVRVSRDADGFRLDAASLA